LKEILLKRLGGDVSLVDEKALVFASRKVAKGGGDARELLHVMSGAISEAKAKLTQKQLKEKGVSEIIIKLPHVMKALTGDKNHSMINIIKGLPQNAKTVLCVAVALGEVGSAWKYVSSTNLQKYCGEAAGHNVFDNWSSDSFRDTVGQLDDCGLIHEVEADQVDFQNAGETRYRIGVQIEDVELAISEILLTNQFYKTLVEFVKKNDIEQKSA
jgi:Cdc6-like AAA superfamily ATPase